MVKTIVIKRNPRMSPQAAADLRIIRENRLVMEMTPLKALLTLAFHRQSQCDRLICWDVAWWCLPCLWLAKRREMKIVAVITKHGRLTTPPWESGLMAMISRCLERVFFSLIDVVLANSAHLAFQARRSGRDGGKVIMSRPVPQVNASLHNRSKRGVLTLADVNDESIQSHRLSLFKNIAKAMPTVPFYLVGEATRKNADFLFDLPPNLIHLSGRRDSWALNEAALYCQLSNECDAGFNALKARAHGMTLVVDDQSAAFELAKNDGEIVPGDVDVDALKRTLTEAIEKATSIDHEISTMNERNVLRRLGDLLHG